MPRIRSNPTPDPVPLDRIEALEREVHLLRLHINELRRGRSTDLPPTPPTLALLHYLAGREGPARFGDIVMAAASSGIVNSETDDPDRNYSALHSRLAYAKRKGWVQRVAWGRWTITDRGQQVVTEADPKYLNKNRG